MFVPSRLVKTLAVVSIGAAVILCADFAQAQISGSIAGNEAPGGAVLVTTDQIANGITDGTSNTILVGELVSGYGVAFEGARRVRVSADVTTTDPAGVPRTTRIIAVLIGSFAARTPGLSSYADEACELADGREPENVEQRVCALLSRRFTAFVEEHRLAVSPAAVMVQTARGIAIWDPR